MSVTISSIHYCPVKSVSFQSIQNCEIKKNIGIVGDRIFAFAKGLDLEQAKLFEKNPEERRGKWNKILTLKNSPFMNKYNFLLDGNNWPRSDQRKRPGPLLTRVFTIRDLGCGVRRGSTSG